MRIKAGASVRGIQPEMVIAMLVANETFKARGIRATLTEGTGGTHAIGSSHYIGFGIDMRDSQIPLVEQEAMRKELEDDLGGSVEFQVLNEELHYHIQLKPRKQVQA